MELFKIHHINKAELYIASKPNTAFGLENEIKTLGSNKENVVLCSLLTKKEIVKYNLDLEKKICELNKIAFTHLEITDESIPGYVEFKNLILILLKKSKTNEHIIIHCKHGIGRSGMVAVAMLLHHGYNLKDACQLATKARGYDVPQSKSQRKLLSFYHNEISKEN